MAIYQHKDGELRIIEAGYNGGSTRYIEILFADANLTGPVARAQTEERLVLDRGVLDSNAHYVESGDMARLEPLTLTFSCQQADTKNSQLLLQLLSGASVLSVGATTYQMHSIKNAGDSIYGLTTALPNFKDTTYKIAYRVEVLYSGTSDVGRRWDEVYFPPAEQSMTESEEAITLNLSGMVYGGVTTITGFTSGASVQAMT